MNRPADNLATPEVQPNEQTEPEWNEDHRAQTQYQGQLKSAGHATKAKYEASGSQPKLRNCIQERQITDFGLEWISEDVADVNSRSCGNQDDSNF
jgi:hypothetical protein